MSVLYCTLYPFNLPLMASLVSCKLPVDCQCRLVEWFCVYILYLNSPRVVMSVLYCTLYPFNLPPMVSLVSCTGCQWIVRANTLIGSAYIFYTLITLGNECVILYLISFQSSSHGISSILYRLPVNCQCRLIKWFCVHILYHNYLRIVMSVLYCTL